MRALVLLVLSLVFYNTAATVVDDGRDCDGTRNCTEVTPADCIKYYNELELAICYS